MGTLKLSKEEKAPCISTGTMFSLSVMSKMVLLSIPPTALGEPHGN